MREAIKFFLKNPVAALIAATAAVIAYLGFKLNRAENQRDTARHELVKEKDSGRLREIEADLDELARESAEKKRKMEEAVAHYIDHKSEIDN